MKTTSNLSIKLACSGIWLLSTGLLGSCDTTQDTANMLEGKVNRETISLAPKVPGRILDIRVNESDMVQQGDTLLVLDVPEVEAKLAQAEGALSAAEAQRQMAVHGATAEQQRQAEAARQAAQEQFNFARKSLERVRAMYQDSLIPAQQYDETLAKYNAAQAQLNAASAKLEEVERGTRQEQVAMASGQRAQARGAVQEATVALNERYLIAPRAMTVETIALNEGELALPGYNAVVGYDLNSTYFRFTVTESNLNKFKKGEVYQVELPFADRAMQARLIGVKQLPRYADQTSAYPQYQLGETVYELKLEPVNKQEAAELYVNTTATLRLP